MSNLRTTTDLKNLVLQHCGELTDGTSSYDQVATNYIDSAHKQLIAGGSLFGFDVDEPWVWAKAKYPIVFNLLPQYSAGFVTLANGSRSGSFTIAPSMRMKDYSLRVGDQYQLMVIRQHTATTTSFQLDQPWYGAGGNYNFIATKTDYDLYDNTLIIDDFNQTFEFTDAGGKKIATVPQGVYQTTDFAIALQSAMTLAGANIPQVSFNALTRTFTVAQGSASLLLNIATATFPQSGWPSLGFTTIDHAGSISYTSESPYQAIERLIMPFNVRSGSGSYLTSNVEAGKVMGVSLASLNEGGLLYANYSGVPTRFAMVRDNPNGTKRVRFDTCPTEDYARIEIEYIPVPADLQDNATSVPLVPKAYREYLVYAAAYRLMMDKSDNRSAEFSTLAATMLKALVNSQRGAKAGTNSRYGRIIPRVRNPRIGWY
jgi:hypothetical protein